MKTFIIITSLIVLSWTSTAKSDDSISISCGSSHVSFFNSNIIASPFFIIKVRDFYVPLEVDREYLELRCEKTNSGTPLVLFRYHCGGTGCSEGSYGIVDADNPKLILVPSERYISNKKDAEVILGHPIKDFDCLGRHSKSSFVIPNKFGDYCFMSPLELG